jgi:hypothetical protein
MLLYGNVILAANYLSVWESSPDDISFEQNKKWSLEVTHVGKEHYRWREQSIQNVYFVKQHFLFFHGTNMKNLGKENILFN